MVPGPAGAAGPPGPPSSGAERAISDIEYDGSNRPTLVSYADGGSRALTYQAGRIDTITEVIPGQTTVVFRVNYDSNGRPISKTIIS
jgi:hypothetical protein